MGLGTACIPHLLSASPDTEQKLDQRHRRHHSPSWGPPGITHGSFVLQVWTLPPRGRSPVRGPARSQPPPGPESRRVPDAEVSEPTLTSLPPHLSTLFPSGGKKGGGTRPTLNTSWARGTHTNGGLHQEHPPPLLFPAEVPSPHGPHLHRWGLYACGQAPPTGLPRGHPPVTP